jgi:hypothetical protein
MAMVVKGMGRAMETMNLEKVTREIQLFYIYVYIHIIKIDFDGDGSI